LNKLVRSVFREFFVDNIQSVRHP